MLQDIPTRFNATVRIVADDVCSIFLTIVTEYGTTAYQVVNGHCEYRNYEKAPHQLCKHRRGAAIARRAQDLLQAHLHGAANGQAAASPVEIPAPPAPAAEAPGLPALLGPYLVTLHGR